MKRMFLMGSDGIEDKCAWCLKPNTDESKGWTIQAPRFRENYKIDKNVRYWFCCLTHCEKWRRQVYP